MNIALSALIISILLIPGAVSLNAYYTSLREPNSSNLHINFTDSLLKGLLISMCAHLIGLGIIHLIDSYIGVRINFQRFYEIITATKTNLTNIDFSIALLQFLFYILLLSAVTYALTKLIKRLIINNSWDLKYNALKTTNYWYIVFSGRYLDRSPKKFREDIDFIYIDILTTKDIVYSGILFEFKYSPTKGDLETLVLTNAAKRTYIITDSEHHKLRLEDASFIKGDIFIIPTSEILNMNVSYIKVREYGDNPQQIDIEFPKAS